MKALLIIIAIALALLFLASWEAYNTAAHPVTPVRCNTFRTYREAKDFFDEYDANYLDRDHDGVPCESLL